VKPARQSRSVLVVDAEINTRKAEYEEAEGEQRKLHHLFEAEALATVLRPLHAGRKYCTPV